MTFPVVTADSVSSTTGNTTAPTTTIPTNCAVGDLLLLICATDNTASLTPDSDLTTILVNDATQTVFRFHVLAKISDGTESGGTWTHSLAASESITSFVYRIESGTWSGNLSEIELNVVASASTLNPDPPSVTASWGSDDNLFIAGQFCDFGARTTDAAPTNYSNLFSVPHPDNFGGRQSGGFASRQLASASDDPSTFTISASTLGNAFTIVIRGASAGGGTNVSYSVNETEASSSSIKVLAKTSYSVNETETLSFSLSAQQSTNIAYNVTEQELASYDLQALAKLIYSVLEAEISSASFAAIADVSYSILELEASSFALDASTGNNVTYNVAEQETASTSFSVIIDVAYSVQELESVNYSYNVISDLNYSVTEQEQSSFAINASNSINLTYSVLEAETVSAQLRVINKVSYNTLESETINFNLSALIPANITYNVNETETTSFNLGTTFYSVNAFNIISADRVYNVTKQQVSFDAIASTREFRA